MLDDAPVLIHRDIQPEAPAPLSGMLRFIRYAFMPNRLRLDQPGLKVLDFHPNMVFVNAATNADYLESKPFYHDYERLLKFRRPGRGVRTMFLELLDEIATRKLPTATLSEVNCAWRKRKVA